MFRWLAICFLAFAVAKWSGNVLADDELDEEEKRLLLAIEDVLEEDNEAEKRDVSFCDTVQCLSDEECVLVCCDDECSDRSGGEYDVCVDACVHAYSQEKREFSCDTECDGSDDPDQCKEDCEENNLLKRRMELAASAQVSANRQISGLQKKFFRFPRIRIPPIPRIRIPPIPRIRFPRIRIPPIPRIPIPRIRIPPIPRIRIPRIRIPRFRFGKK